MEVDYHSIDDCKESVNDALLPLHQLSEVASSDFPLPITDGQMQISRLAHHCLPLKPTLTDAPVCTLYCYADALLVYTGPLARVDSADGPLLHPIDHGQSYG